MGSVPHLYTTGDNDPEIEPVQYYRHYLYCDDCGSFDLGTWFTPDNHEALTRAGRWLGLAALVAAAATVVAWLMLGPLAAAGGIVVVGLLVARSALASKVERAGMRCRECGATYAGGTPFFTDLDANPRNLTLEDVPRPLGVSHFERGRYVGPAPEESPSGLPS